MRIFLFLTLYLFSIRWIKQIIAFIEEVIVPEHRLGGDKPLKVHLVGNSVGGHLAVHVAFLRPDLISSICLLNPTPVWGLNLPGKHNMAPCATKQNNLPVD